MGTCGPDVGDDETDWNHLEESGGEAAASSEQGGPCASGVAIWQDGSGRLDEQAVWKREDGSGAGDDGCGDTWNGRACPDADVVFTAEPSVQFVDPGCLDSASLATT